MIIIVCNLSIQGYHVLVVYLLLYLCLSFLLIQAEYQMRCLLAHLLLKYTLYISSEFPNSNFHILGHKIAQVFYYPELSNYLYMPSYWYSYQF